MSVKNLVLELNAKMLSSNQIAGFLNFNISKTIGDIKLIFCMQVHIDDVFLGGRGQSYPGMPKEAIRTLRSQNLKEVLS